MNGHGLNDHSTLELALCLALPWFCERTASKKQKKDLCTFWSIPLNWNTWPFFEQSHSPNSILCCVSCNESAPYLAIYASSTACMALAFIRLR
jgi:hypothetical protein